MSLNVLDEFIYISNKPVEDYFATRVNGDDMKFAGILNKSVIVCHKQSIVKDKDIIVAYLNGKIFVRRYKKFEKEIYLMPENFNCYPIHVKENDDFKVLGKVEEARNFYEK